jgi:hypothetical protein
MRNQAKYLVIYLCVLCFLVGSVINIAQAEENAQEDVQAQSSHSSPTENQQQDIELSQAQLDQILAPIALYPDTLLSHIFVASTYPLEVVQAARWRNNNSDLSEQEALNGVDKKDWEPSVKALVPFNDLLQTLSEDLEWLQALGNAFLFDEERVLDSVQTLRQKAYAQGNLNDNDYINVEEEKGEILIQNVEKEIVYIPHYDTRVVYGNWWWNDHPPLYWHRPSHYVWNAGFYWSSRFLIRPKFYFSGVHWGNRHVVSDHAYRTHVDNNYWSHSHSRQQRVRVNEYQRWTHDSRHRRGVQYKHNGKRIIRNSENPIRYVSSNSQSHPKKQIQIDKQRVLNINNYPKSDKNTRDRVKHKLASHNRQNATNKSKKASRESSSRYVNSNTIKPIKNNGRKIDKWQKNKTIRPEPYVKKQLKSHSVNQSLGQVARNSANRNNTKSYQQRPSNNSKPYIQKQVYSKPIKTGFQHKSSNSSRSKPSYQSKPRHSSSGMSNKSRPVKVERNSRAREKR